MVQVSYEPRRAGGFLQTEMDGTLSRDAVRVAAGQTLPAGAVLGRVVKGPATAIKLSGAGNGTLSAVQLGAAAEIGQYLLVCAGGTFAVAATAGTNTGNGTITPASPAFDAATVKAGAYRLTCIHEAEAGGKFLVQDPDGITVGVAAAGVAFNGPVKATIAAGAQAFVVGDSFVLTVAPSVPAGGGVFRVTAPAGARLPDLTVGEPYASAHFGLTVGAGAVGWAVGDTLRVTVPAAADEVTGYDPAAVDGSAVPVGILYDAVYATDTDRRAVMIARCAEVKGVMLVWPAGITEPAKAAAIAALAARTILVR